jgi:signal transduction histidine kinase
MLGLDRSLRLKLIGVILVTTLAALVVALAAIVTYDLRAYQRTWTADLSTQAELLGRMSAPALAFDDPKAATGNLELLRLRPAVRAAAIYTARGTLFASYRRPGVTGAFAPLPEADGMRIAGRELVLYKRIVSDREILGTIFLRADYELPDRVWDYVVIAAAVALLAMIVALALSARLARVVTTPVLDVAAIARDVVEHGDYSRRARKRSDDEVGALADAFNGMLDEIQRRTGELAASNDALERHVAERTRAEAEVLRLNAELEDRVRERTAQLEAANHELEAFSFSVSHDLRAPLRAVDGFSQALLEDFPDNVPDEARRYLARIRAATLRMGQLIEDLLNLSRVSRGALERVPVDLAELARQVVADLRQHDPARAVEVSVWNGMDTLGDPRLLRAALENLIGNAWKFTARTAAPRIEIGALRESGRQVFFVRDNGAGFSMDYADKLFAPFQRLHSGNEFAGTGIGLATVQRIVYRHGGRIWADAQVGAGATFFFTLAPDGAPRAAAPEPTDAARTPETSPCATRTTPTRRRTRP